MTWPATFDAAEGAPYSPATIGVMIDESFGRAATAIRPRGRSIVTSEISVDLVDLTRDGIGTLSCDASVVAVTPTAALAHSMLTDEHGAILATASSWCRFIDGYDESHPYPEGPKPPADLALDRLLTRTVNPAEQTVTARFTPGQRCANDLGTLHGGIALGASLDVGLTWLEMIYPTPSVSSIHLNLLRPAALDRPIEITASPIHTGRGVAVAHIASRSTAGKLTAIATVTGVPFTADTSHA